jgi:excisionase family DNA binding protein
MVLDANRSASVMHLPGRSHTDRVIESDLRGCPPMIEGMERHDRLLNVEELANYLGVPVATLYQWRYRSEGPPGFRVGRHLRYRWVDVEEWISEQLRRPTTIKRQDRKDARAL